MESMNEIGAYISPFQNISTEQKNEEMNVTDSKVTEFPTEEKDSTFLNFNSKCISKADTDELIEKCKV